MTTQEWASERCEVLGGEGASEAMVGGYLDCANAKAPDPQRFRDEPFGALHYLEGYALASYEIGPPEVMSDRVLELVA
jgi:hypothetical protein